MQVETGRALRGYQHDAVEFLQRKRRGLIAYPPGTGKTATIARWLHEEQAERSLIVCPVPVMTHWNDELLSWTPVGDDTLSIGLYRGEPKRRGEILDFIVGSPAPAFLIVSYETFRGDIERLKAVHWDAVVFDESHRLKNRQSVSFKAAGQIAKLSPRLALLTGTPIINRADELWTSLALMDPQNYRGFWRWAEHYFHITLVRRRNRMVREICTDTVCPTCGGQGLRRTHLQELHGKVDQRVLSKPIEVLLPDLPEVSETYIEIDLSKAERKAYDQMNDELWMSVNGNLTMALNGGSKQQRLRQLASDWSAFDPDAGAGSKVKAAVQLIEDLEGEQVVVFCAYRQTVQAMLHELDHIRAAGVSGMLNTNTREHNLATFKAGKTQVLVGTLNTIGEGVDGLQCARNAIFLDRAWTPAAMNQAIGRLRRQGQRNNVNVMHVVARDTVDDVIATALRRKEAVIEAIMRWRKSVSPSVHA